MKLFTTILFTVFFVLPFSHACLAKDPIFDTSTWDRYGQTMGEIEASVNDADSARFMIIISAYTRGTLSDIGDLPMEDEDGNELDFEFVQQEYIRRLEPLHGLTLTEIFKKYEADGRAYAELHGLSAEFLRY